MASRPVGQPGLLHTRGQILIGFRQRFKGVDGQMISAGRRVKREVAPVAADVIKRPTFG